MAGTKSATNKSATTKKTTAKKTAEKKEDTKPKVVNAETPKVDNIEPKTEKFVMPDEIDLSQRVVVRNIANWSVSFTRFIDTPGGNIDTVGVVVQPHGVIQLSRNELVAQTNNSNGTLFAGTDGQGSHATLYIEDKVTRVYLGFETADTHQNIFTEEGLLKIFEIRSQKDFEEAYKNLCVTRAEKLASVEAIKNNEKFNDYRKIHFIEKFTGYKVNE